MNSRNRKQKGSKMKSAQIFSRTITPCLLFDGRSREVAEFYVSLFIKSKITHQSPYTTNFNLDGQDFVALDGPKSEFTWAVSFYVACKTQKDIDYYWSKLRAGGGE